MLINIYRLEDGLWHVNKINSFGHGSHRDYKCLAIMPLGNLTFQPPAPIDDLDTHTLADCLGVDCF